MCPSSPRKTLIRRDPEQAICHKQVRKKGKKEKTIMRLFHEKVTGWWLHPNKAGELGNAVSQTSSILM